MIHKQKGTNMASIKIHWSFWVICVVALIWNIMGEYELHHANESRYVGKLS